MIYLHEKIAEQVKGWREAGYPHDIYPAISEILDYAREDDGNRRFLRTAQLQALETYWYLRLVLNTPAIPQLYEQLFSKTSDRLHAMGISAKLFEEADFNLDNLIQKILIDNHFVRVHKLESLRETFTLNYSSYILALAMGAGKTILMGTIAATEFAMAQEYPAEDSPFVKNALIFAPGKTIIESLREIADIPFDKILPPRMYGPFSATLNLNFTRDGDPEISGVIDGSLWNLIITNTEKIRIQKSTGRKNGLSQIDWMKKDQDHEAKISTPLL